MNLNDWLKAGALTCVAAVISGAASAATITLTPSKDNTIYAESTGNSNGAGSGLFAGRVGAAGGGAVRRALVAFNVGGSLSTGSTVTNVTLTLFCEKEVVGNKTVELHKVTADWGEGTSSATGQGAPATTNDATWTSRFFGTASNWTTPGGDFSATVSASQTVGATGTSAVFGSTAQLVADVQGWVTSPATNFGWLIKGDESTASTVKELGSKEDGTPANRPQLTITYNPPASVNEWSMY